MVPCIEQRAVAQNILAYVIDQILRLLHPFVPFITEGIFQQLNEISPRRGLKGLAELSGKEALIVAKWPVFYEEWIDGETCKQIDEIQKAIRAIRDLRSKYNKKPGEKLTVSVNGPAAISDVLNGNCELICQLANLERFECGEGIAKPDKAAAAIVEQMQIFLHDAIDVEAERARLEKQKALVEKGIKSFEAKLGNENFVNRAKDEVVQQTKDKLAEMKEQMGNIEKLLLELES